MDAIPEPVLAWWALQPGLDVTAEAAELVARMESVAAEWGLALGPVLQGGVMSLVRLAERDGREYVLKAVPRFAHWAHDEATALHRWAGRGAVHLWGSSLDGRVLLLERLEHGRPASVDQVADVLRLLQSAEPRGVSLPPLASRVEEEFARARRRVAGIPARTVRRCHRVALELCASDRAPVMVHGDLQQKNLLWRAGVAVAIDPIPAVGDATYDIALWALTERPYGDGVERAAAMAQRLGHDADRAALMCQAMSAAVAIWTHVPERTAALVEIAATIPRR